MGDPNNRFDDNAHDQSESLRGQKRLVEHGWNLIGNTTSFHLLHRWKWTLRLIAERCYFRVVGLMSAIICICDDCRKGVTDLPPCHCHETLQSEFAERFGTQVQELHPHYFHTRWEIRLWNTALFFHHRTGFLSHITHWRLFDRCRIFVHGLVFFLDVDCLKACDSAF